MRTVTSTQCKNRIAEILKEVATSGETVLVTRRGKPLVRVEPAIEKLAPIHLGALIGTGEIRGNIVRPVFKEWEDLEVRAKG